MEGPVVLKSGRNRRHRLRGSAINPAARSSGASTPDGFPIIEQAGRKVTLTEKLVATKPCKVIKEKQPSPTSVGDWHKRMEYSEKMKEEHVSRVGRKLNVMLEQIRAARTVPKLVQAALAEAMDAHSNAVEARKERLNVTSQWIEFLGGK